MAPSNDQIRKHRTLKKELTHIKNTAKIIDALRDKYERYKRYFILLRYRKLKIMIRRAVSEFQQEMEDVHQEEADGGGLKELAERAKKLLNQAEYYSDMSSKQVEAEIVETSKEIADSKEELHRNTEKLERLNDSYQESKDFFPIRRYRAMKRMIKSCTREETSE